MTLLENLMLVPQQQWGERLLSLVYGWGRVRGEEAESRKAAFAIMERVELLHQKDTISPGRVSSEMACRISICP
jgi:ABC-type branched-subunit amino acid transport system ATPase component